MAKAGRKVTITYCEICKCEVKYFTRHLRLKHPELTEMNYYEKYIRKSPKEGLCKICGKPLIFKGAIKGYGLYCGPSCEMKDKETRDKMAKTYFERTGYTHNFKDPKIKDHIRKTQEELYGGYGFASKQIVDKVISNYNEKNDTNYTNLEELAKSEESETKRKNTRREHYNGSYYSEEGMKKIIQASQNKDAVEKRIKTRMENTNGEWITDKMKTAFNEKSKELYKDYGFIEMKKCDDEQRIFCKCPKCGGEYNINYRSFRSRIISGFNPCIICEPLGSLGNATSQAEKNVLDYIKQFYKKEILENDRTILDGKELDILIPEKKIAIEYDGLYWHCEINRDEKFHLMKTKKCEEKGLQLIHIFEDEWKYKQEIVKSRLRGLLGLNERIFARKCECKEISNEDSRKFLDENHIQGNCVSRYRYGLYYNDELVSVMTFGESRFKKGEFELLRFANKLYNNVVGGAGKLFYHFLKEHPEIVEITSYADRRWSKGNLYEKLGFLETEKTKPNYFYIVDGMRQSRLLYQKHRLISEGADPNKTEHQIMLEKGYYRIYDCGNLKYKYIRSNKDE